MDLNAHMEKVGSRHGGIFPFAGFNRIGPILDGQTPVVAGQTG